MNDNNQLPLVVLDRVLNKSEEQSIVAKRQAAYAAEGEAQPRVEAIKSRYNELFLLGVLATTKFDEYNSWLAHTNNPGRHKNNHKEPVKKAVKERMVVTQKARLQGWCDKFEKLPDDDFLAEVMGVTKAHISAHRSELKKEGYEFTHNECGCWTVKNNNKAERDKKIEAIESQVVVLLDELRKLKTS